MTDNSNPNMARGKTKVLFLSAWYPTENDAMFGLFVQKHAKSMSEACKVIVIHACPDPVRGEKIRLETNHSENFTEYIAYYPVPGKGLFSGMRSGMRWFRAYNYAFVQMKKQWGLPQLVHANILTRVAVLALLIKLRYNIPYIISEHWSRYFFPTKAFRNKLHYSVTRFVIRHAEALTVVSEALGDAMKEMALCCNYSIVPNVIETDLFRIKPQKSSRSRKQIVHISCFEEKSKNLSNILKATSILSKERQDFNLTMVGEGMDLEYAKNLARQYGLTPEFVTFTGLREGAALADILAEADFSILFSNYETFGIVVYESLACGIPVVVSNVAGFKNDIKKPFGRVVVEHNPQAFASAMDEMLDTCNNYNPNSLRSYILECFSSEKVRTMTLALYNNALKTR